MTSTDKFIHAFPWAGLEEECIMFLFDQFNMKPTKPAKKLMSFFVANLMRMAKADIESLSISLARTPGINYRSLIKLINELEEDGLIEVQKGLMNPETGIKLSTKITTSPQLDNLLYFQKGKFLSDSRIILKSNLGRKIISRDELYGEGIDRNRTLDRYQDFLSNFEILSGNKIIDSCFLRSIYKDSYELHGRIYSDWQLISSSERSMLTLGGSEVCELDYACMGVNIIYNMLGKTLSKDAYTFSDKVTRPQAKKVVNILINAASKPQALAAIRSNFGNEFNARTVLREAESYHSPIKSMFYSSIGLKTMNLDAKICDRVINGSIDKSVPILSIHDGFVLPLSFKEEIKHIMKESYFHFMNNDIDVNED